MLLFTIQSQLRAANRKLYVPGEGRSISDINKVGRMEGSYGATPQSLQTPRGGPIGGRW